MHNFFDIFYNIIFIPFSLILIKIFRKFNKKLDERESYLASHQVSFNNLTRNKTVWVHASSMGEFEQAKPVIELLKDKYPEIKIFVSFFSPSGFNTQKNYKFADYICYLPFDTMENANSFVRIIEPDLAIFIRYDIWRNYLKILKKIGIPTLLINATQPSNGFYRNFPITKNFIKSNVNLFTKIITVDKIHTDYFNSIGLNKIVTMTDTRFDRIAEFVKNAQSNMIFPKELISEKWKVLVAGSVWEKDIDIISNGVDEFNKVSEIKIKVIYVPHEPTQENLEYITQKLESYIFLSEILKALTEGKIHKIKEKIENSDIIVDSIGYLLRLYNFADIAYVGGAFGAGIHSVTEAAGYGLPIITGPNLSKSTDAVNLSYLGALKTIENKEEFLDFIVHLFQDYTLIKKLGTISRNYIFGSIGSSQKIIKIVESFLNLS